MLFALVVFRRGAALLQRNTAESEEANAADDSEKPQVEYDPF